MEKVLLASAARTATNSTPDQAGAGFSAAHVIVDVTAWTAGSVTPKLQGKDIASGKYYDLLIGPALVATGTTVLKIGRGISPAANGAAGDLLPETWRVVLTHADATSITYSVGAVVVP